MNRHRRLITPLTGLQGFSFSVPSVTRGSIYYCSNKESNLSYGLKVTSSFLFDSYFSTPPSGDTAPSLMLRPQEEQNSLLLFSLARLYTHHPFQSQEAQAGSLTDASQVSPRDMFSSPTTCSLLSHFRISRAMGLSVQVNDNRNRPTHSHPHSPSPRARATCVL